MKPLHTLILTGLLMATSHIKAAELTMANVFSDHMVLQRNKPVRLYGKGPSGAVITVEFMKQRAVASVGADGTWQTELAPIPATAEGQRLIVQCGSDTLELSDILIGDVWICSGQSNMGWGLFQSWPVPETFPHADRLRLLKSQTPNGTATPRDEVTIDEAFQNSWQRATNAFALPFSAVGYHFGLNLVKESKVPVGLIMSAVGGTPIQSWTPKAVFEADPFADELMNHYRKELAWAGNNLQPEQVTGYRMRHPAWLYNGMLHPLTRLPIKGVIWYQGESNELQVEAYRSLFPAAIQGWRSAWNQGDFPFLFVQLPGFVGHNDWLRERSQHWPELREAQETALSLPNTGMVVAIDQGNYNDIHPRVKHEIGRRLALQARKLEGEKVVADGPFLKTVEFKGKKALLHFDAVGDGLETRRVVMPRNADAAELDDNPIIVPAEPLAGFEVAGKEGVFHPPEARIISAHTVELTADCKIEQIRYAYTSFPRCNLYNSAGLPARPFRYLKSTNLKMKKK
jgi:sialate O-acetylesterase